MLTGENPGEMGPLFPGPARFRIAAIVVRENEVQRGRRSNESPATSGGIVVLVTLDFGVGGIELLAVATLSAAEVQL